MSLTAESTRFLTPWRASEDRPLNATDEELNHWRAAAERAAAVLKQDVLTRDRSNAEPFAEVDVLCSEGLLDILIPAEFGGPGGHWESAFEAVRIVSRVDGSLGQLLAYHFINQAGIAFYGAPEAQGEWWAKTAQAKWLWADSVNPTDPDLTLTPAENGDGWVLNGKKRYSTGSSVAEVIVINALVRGGDADGQVLAFVVEREREGLTLGGDWDNLGQRLTGSGSVTYTNVAVRDEDVLGPVTDVPVSTLITPGIQLAFGAFYLGVAEGALAQGREILLARPNAWFLSDAPVYAKDPLFQRRIGELKAHTAAVAALAEKLFRRFDTELDADAAYSDEERGAFAVAIAELKVAANDVALQVASGIFDVTGSGSTANTVGLDLHWRNVRTHSLHDPVDYKKVEVGAYFLDGTTQPISLYT